MEAPPSGGSPRPRVDPLSAQALRWPTGLDRGDLVRCCALAVITRIWLQTLSRMRTIDVRADQLERVGLDGDVAAIRVVEDHDQEDDEPDRRAEECGHGQVGAEALRSHEVGEHHDERASD